MKKTINEELKKARNKYLIKVIATFIIGAIILFFLYFIIFQGFLSYTLGNILYNTNRTLYNFLIDYKELILILSLVAIIIYALSKMVYKLFYDMSLIINSVDNILNKEEEMIILPSELSTVAEKMNHMKNNYIRNERIAKEAEEKKNDLIVYMAHDLKTPLTSIIGYLSLLEEEKQISKPLREKYVGIALDKSKRLEDLINEFFDITRFNSQKIILHKQKIDLTYMLEQLVDECYPMLQTKKLECAIQSPKNIYMQADSNYLARVFDNLLKNAINYSYEETKIEIIVQLQEVSKENQEKENRDNIIICFRNKAPMIPNEEKTRIFEKFYRMDSSRSSTTGGSGLGLAIAKQIIEAHGGKIKVDSNEEATEFVVVLGI